MEKFLVPLQGRVSKDADHTIDESALLAALTLGHRLGAHVEAFCIEAEAETSKHQMADWLPGSAINELLDLIARENDRRRQSAKALFDRLSAHSGCVRRSVPRSDNRCSVDFVEHVGSLGGSLARRGRVADLIVTAKPDRVRSEALPPFIESALTQTGRPVLISPQSPFETIGSRILIAWDGKEDASRAVALSRDLLRCADRVTVVSVRESGPVEPSAGDLADYLKWQAIEAEHLTLERRSASIAAMLLRHAVEVDADLIVLGASLRGRFSRLLFGSVSAEILEQADRPIIMAD